MSSQSIRRPRPRCLFVYAVLCPLALVGLGYLSSVASMRACEDRVGRWLIEEPMAGEPFYVDARDKRESSVILDRLGAKYTVFDDYDEKPHVDFGGRIASVSRARVTYPFLVSVDHECLYGSMGGEGATAWFFCLFRVTVKLCKQYHWKA